MSAPTKTLPPPGQSGRLPYHRVLPLAILIRDILAPYCAPDKCVIAGSLRRKLETIGDINIVCEPRDWTGEAHQALRDRVKAKTRLITDGLQALMVELPPSALSPQPVRLDVWMARPTAPDLFWSLPGNFGSLLLYRTGPAAFNQALLWRAESLGLRWQLADGVYQGRRRLASETEQQIFRALNLPDIAPEERQ